MPDSDADSRRRLKIGCLPLAGGLIVGLLVLALLLFYLSDASSQRAIDAEIARVRAKGQPATAAEMAKWHAPPANKTDLTPLWLAAIESLDSPAYNLAAKSIPTVGAEGEIPLPGVPWPLEKEAQEFLEQNQATLEMLHLAAEQEGVVRYPLNFQDGMGMLLPHVQKLRGAARLLVLEAECKARQGDVPGTTQALHTLFQAAATLNDEPVLISQLVRMAILNMGCHEFERLLPHVPFTAADLILFKHDLAAAQSRLPLQHALWGERVLGLQMFQQGPAGVEGAPPGFIWRLTRGADTVAYLNLMSSWEEAADLPWPQALAEMGKTEQKVQALAGGSVLARQQHALTLLMLPALQSPLQGGARNTALLAATETALALEHYRLEQGRLPGKLADLVPRYLTQVPTDPFDGQPLRYLVKPSECIVYSIGVDAKDDGGVGDDSGKPDVVFRLATPERTAP